MRSRAGSSPSSLKEGFEQLIKGSKAIAHEMALVRAELSSLRKANEALTKRKSRKGKYIQAGGSLTTEEALQLIPSEPVVEQGGGGESSKRVRASGSGGQQRRCGRCGKAGHNVRTCQEDVLDTSDSELI